MPVATLSEADLRIAMQPCWDWEYQEHQNVTGLMHLLVCLRVWRGMCVFVCLCECVCVCVCASISVTHNHGLHSSGPATIKLTEVKLSKS